MHKMYRNLTLLFATVLCLPQLLWAQPEFRARMKAHIEILASDSLQGREAGTEAELMAAEYIADQFSRAALTAAGTTPGSYLQPFEFFAGRIVHEETFLDLDDKRITPGVDYLVLPESMTADFGADIVAVGYGIDAPDLGRDDYKGKNVENKFVVVERGHHEPENPHSKFADASTIAAKLKAAQAHGAIGVIFVDPAGQAMEPYVPNYQRKVAESGVMAIYMPGRKAASLDGKNLYGYIRIEDQYRTGHNVIGFLDHGAPHTIVIGGHYDHLGMGEEGSLHRGELAIHNGADDNASGTALVIELAKELQAESYKKFNYLFMAFSGEEKGLLGSNYWTKNPTKDLGTLAAMINFDMVGRLDPAKNTLGINGTGTSPVWKEILATVQIDDMQVKQSESGVGPSDQTSFYLKDIPAIHYFSGTHSDYHKPSDDAHLINYDGIDKIHRHVVAVITALNAKGTKPAFTTTKQDENGDVPRWKVTLGVVPDYMFSGTGMRIDGVTDGKPAAKAGLKAGDVVVKLGATEVNDMMSYMRALSTFDKGQKTVVEFMREGKRMKKKLQF